MTKLKDKYKMFNCMKGRCGRKVTVRTARNIAAVQRSLKTERAAIRTPGTTGPSARRHTEVISKSSYNRITRKDLRLKPYKILRLRKVTPQQTLARLKMGRLLERKPLS